MQAIHEGQEGGDQGGIGLVIAPLSDSSGRCYPIQLIQKYDGWGSPLSLSDECIYQSG